MEPCGMTKESWMVAGIRGVVRSKVSATTFRTSAASSTVILLLGALLSTRIKSWTVSSSYFLWTIVS